MSMIVDTRKAIDAEDVRKLNAMEIREDDEGRPNRNDLRRYRRAIRRMSGLSYVTTHHAEHNPLNNPPTLIVAFGRHN